MKILRFLFLAIQIERTIAAYQAYRAGGHEPAEAVLLAVQQTDLFPI